MAKSKFSAAKKIVIGKKSRAKEILTDMVTSGGMSKPSKFGGLGGALGSIFGGITAAEVLKPFLEPYAAWSNPDPYDTATSQRDSAESALRNASSISAAPSQPPASMKLWGSPFGYENYFSKPEPKPEPLTNLSPIEPEPIRGEPNILDPNNTTQPGAKRSARFGQNISLDGGSVAGGVKPKSKKKAPIPLGDTYLSPFPEESNPPAITGQIPELPPLESKELPTMSMTANRGSLPTSSDEPVSDQMDAFDTYFNTWKNRPEEEDYKPSIWRKLLGAAAGFGEGWSRGPIAGIESAQHVVRTPYERAEEEWKSQLDELEPLMKQQVYKDLGSERNKIAKMKLEYTNQTYQEKNRIERLKAEGKITNDKQLNELKAIALQAENYFKMGALELGYAKLAELKRHNDVIEGIRGEHESAYTDLTTATAKKRDLEVKLLEMFLGSAIPNPEE